MTFADYQQVPNPPGGRYQLYRGELIPEPYPEHRHKKAQLVIRRLLERAAPDGVVQEEMAYRPKPEYECWGADVGYLTQERWNKIDRWLAGAPDLVVKVLSPSNTAAEMLDKKETCLKNGAREFWLVDLDHRLVEVSTSEGHTRMYRLGQEIPLFFGGSAAVDQIFG